MTELILPPAPFRVTMAQELTSLGREAEAVMDYGCPTCGREVAASGFIDVRDSRDRFGGAGWVCVTCASGLQREEAAAHEAACQEARRAAGALCDETLNGLRAQRDIALARSDWTQIADNADRLGPGGLAAWVAYRADVRAWFVTARDTGEVGAFPEPPE